MGIAKFYRWLAERYPLINQNISAEEIPEFDGLSADPIFPRALAAQYLYPSLSILEVYALRIASRDSVQ